ncbi:hypothetical protein SAMN05428988_3179 [Chitinophaga sp. YR573]|nr:hypothetical protein SAMN05428988_3179 [Chitinophaga sp. YR573]
MLILFCIWVFMLIFSLYVGCKDASMYQISLLPNFTQRGIYNYTLGLHHGVILGQKGDGEHFRIEILTIGFVVFTIEARFYKEVKSSLP